MSQAKRIVKTIFGGVAVPGGGKYQIDRLKRDATFAQIFKSYNQPLRSLCFPREEIDTFCCENANKLNHGCSNFFLTENEGKLVVVHLFLSKDSNDYYEEDLNSTRVWRSQFGHRVIVPQN